MNKIENIPPKKLEKLLLTSVPGCEDADPALLDDLERKFGWFMKTNDKLVFFEKPSEKELIARSIFPFLYNNREAYFENGTMDSISLKKGVEILLKDSKEPLGNCLGLSQIAGCLLLRKRFSINILHSNNFPGKKDGHVQIEAFIKDHLTPLEITCINSFDLLSENLLGNFKRRPINYLLPLLQNSIGRVLNQEEKFKDTIQILSKSIKLAPNLWQSYSTRALAYYNSDDFPNAIKDYTHIIKKIKRSVLYFNRGVCFYYNDQICEANQDFSIALKTADEKQKEEYLEKIKTIKKSSYE